MCAQCGGDAKFVAHRGKGLLSDLDRFIRGAIMEDVYFDRHHRCFTFTSYCWSLKQGIFLAVGLVSGRRGSWLFIDSSASDAKKSNRPPRL